MRWRLGLWAVVIPAIFAIVVVNSIHNRVAEALQLAPPPTTEIPQPVDWVPFRADMRTQHAHGHFTYGRVFRSDDGSTRLDTWGEGDEAPRIISIMNIPLATHFQMTPRGWSSAPMDVDPANYRPVRRRTSERGMSEYLPRLAIQQGEDGAFDALEGLVAYQYLDRNGNLALLAPDLNFFPVLKTSLASGRREMYFNVLLGSVEPANLLPPPTADVTPLSRSRGIVRRPM